LFGTPRGAIIATVIDVSAAAPGAADVAPGTAAFLRLLADPTRRRIFLHLMAGETCNCELVDLLGQPQNLISHHLRQLHQAGLVRSRRDPDDQRWVYYSVAADALAAVHEELGATFSPARLGQRAPNCGPRPRGRA